MVKDFLFKDRDGQTPLPLELTKGLIPKHIQTMGELDEYEEENITEGLLWLAKYTGEYLTYNFWLKLHQKLFNKVWRWAGKVRTHELNNPDFLMPYLVWPSLKQLEGDIRFWLEKKSYPHREIMARFHERIETIHPFANGNGRFGRILTEYLSEKEKQEVPTWGKKLQSDPKQRRQNYLKTLQEARRNGHYASLIDFIFS